MTDRYFPFSPLRCPHDSRLRPACLDRSVPGPVKDVTGRCLFNESSLEEVMKSALTPLTTRLISSEDTRRHRRLSAPRPRRLPPPKGRVSDPLNSADHPLLFSCFFHQLVEASRVFRHLNHSDLTFPTINGTNAHDNVENLPLKGSFAERSGADGLAGVM